MVDDVEEALLRELEENDFAGHDGAPAGATSFRNKHHQPTKTPNPGGVALGGQQPNHKQTRAIDSLCRSLAVLFISTGLGLRRRASCSQAWLRCRNRACAPRCKYCSFCKGSWASRACWSPCLRSSTNDEVLDELDHSR